MYLAVTPMPPISPRVNGIFCYKEARYAKKNSENSNCCNYYSQYCRDYTLDLYQIWQSQLSTKQQPTKLTLIIYNTRVTASHRRTWLQYVHAVLRTQVEIRSCTWATVERTLHCTQSKLMFKRREWLRWNSSAIEHTAAHHLIYTQYWFHWPFLEVL